LHLVARAGPEPEAIFGPSDVIPTAILPIYPTTLGASLLKPSTGIERAPVRIEKGCFLEFDIPAIPPKDYRAAVYENAAPARSPLASDTPGVAPESAPKKPCESRVRGCRFVAST